MLAFDPKFTFDTILFSNSTTNLTERDGEGVKSCKLYSVTGGGELPRGNCANTEDSVK